MIAFVQGMFLKDSQKGALFLPKQLCSWVQISGVLFIQGNPKESIFESFLQIIVSQKLSESILFMNLKSKHSGYKNLRSEGQCIYPV